MLGPVEAHTAFAEHCCREMSSIYIVSACFDYQYLAQGRAGTSISPRENVAHIEQATRLCMQDVFSAGCVLAEMFLDGKLLFDRPQVTPL